MDPTNRFHSIEAGIIRQIVVFTGVASVVTQLLTIREFLAQFQGNEIVIALLMFNWMVLGGVGALLARYVPPAGQNADITRLAVISLGLAFLAAVQIPAIRMLRDIVFTHGAEIGFYPIWCYSFLLISPYTLLLGFALPFSLAVLQHVEPHADGTLIYILDNIGDISGGLLFSFFLVFVMTPFQAAGAAQLPLLISAVRLTSVQRRIPVRVAAAMLLVLFVALIVGERGTLSPGEGTLAAYRESRFGRITVVRSAELTTLFSDGVPLFSNQNVAAAEKAVHYPLSQQSPGGEILLISATGGMMTELAKHRPRHVDYVELDPEISRIQFRFQLLHHYPWLHIIHEDGRKFLKRTQNRYDAILMHLPEPETYQVNRFFTSRFFSLAKRHLKPNGILGFSLDGFDGYLNQTQSAKLSSVFNTAALHFTHVVPLPGQKIFFLCSDRDIDLDIPNLLRSKKIRTDYVEGYFHGEVTADRIRYLKNSLDYEIPPNRDVHPFLMQIMFRQWFEKFHTSPMWFLGLLSVMVAGYIAVFRGDAYLLFSTGCLNMGSEILVIFAFQIFFGYVYVKIGIIITVFLAGLLPGAWLGKRRTGSKKPMMILTEILLILSMFALMIFFQFGGDRSAEMILLAIAFIISFLCGIQFPIVLALSADRPHNVPRAFSADLVGAAFGTLITSLFFIPRFGIVGSAALLAVLKLTSLWVVQRKHEPLQP